MESGYHMTFRTTCFSASARRQPAEDASRASRISNQIVEKKQPRFTFRSST